MKKILSAIVCLGFMMLFVTNSVGATSLVSYETDFETEESYNWMTLKNTDTNGEATNDWAKVVTKAYGEDSDNKALSLRTGENELTEGGGIDTLDYGTFTENPVTGRVIYYFDFMFDAQSIGMQEVNNGTDFAFIRFAPTDSAFFSLIKLIYRPNNRVQLAIPDFSGMVLAEVESDKWHRFVMKYNPTTGKADFACITNIDGSGETNISTMLDYQLTSAGAYTGIRRITMSFSRGNMQAYIDNLKLFNYAETVITESTPEHNDETTTPMEPITLTFNNEIKSINLSLNGTPIDSNSWVKSGNKYRYKSATPLSWNTEYTLSGNVTDVYGDTIAVNISYKTTQQPRSLVEVIGFFDSAEENLTEMQQGVATAKLRFWQTEETSYTYIMALYRDNENKPEMVDVIADAITVSDNNIDKQLSLTIPPEYTDCSIRLFFWNNLSERIHFAENLVVGSTVLE